MTTAKRRKEFLSIGMCGCCGKNPHRPNVSECEDCAERRRVRERAKYVRVEKPKRRSLKEISDERKALGICYKCGKNKPEEGKLSCFVCRSKVNARYQRDKDLCYEKYGGYKCACCGESNKLFLTLDHINNDGNEHRRSRGDAGRPVEYYWIVNNNYPPIYQVLCYNCNCGRYHNGGICPHKNQVSEPSLA